MGIPTAWPVRHDRWRWICQAECSSGRFILMIKRQRGRCQPLSAVGLKVEPMLIQGALCRLVRSQLGNLREMPLNLVQQVLQAIGLAHEPVHTISEALLH